MRLQLHVCAEYQPCDPTARSKRGNLYQRILLRVALLVRDVYLLCSCARPPARSRILYADMRLDRIRLSS